MTACTIHVLWGRPYLPVTDPALAEWIARGWYEARLDGENVIFERVPRPKYVASGHDIGALGPLAHGLWLDGLSQDDVGVLFGRSRETIRHWIAPFALDQDRRRARKANRALWGRPIAKDAPDSVPAEVAAQRAHSLHGRYHTPSESLIARLHECRKELGKVPTHYEYDRWAQAHDAPTHQTFTLRWGTWLKALAAASLVTTKDRKPRADKKTMDDCMRGLIACAVQIGKLPTAVEYDEFSRGSPHPSCITVRKMFRKRWLYAIGCLQRVLLASGQEHLNRYGGKPAPDFIALMREVEAA